MNLWSFYVYFILRLHIEFYEHMFIEPWQKMYRKGFFIRPEYSLQILLILAGDIEFNPDPCQKCDVCLKSIRKNQSKGTCFGCKNNFHLKCLFDKIEKGLEKLYCNLCYTRIEKPDQGVQSTTFSELKTFLKRQGLKFFHQNVNGLFNKYDQVKILLQETQKNIHVFGISESHLSDMFTGN